MPPRPPYRQLWSTMPESSPEWSWATLSAKWITNWSQQAANVVSSGFRCNRSLTIWKSSVDWLSADSVLLDKKSFFHHHHFHCIGLIVSPSTYIVKLTPVFPPVARLLSTQLLNCSLLHRIPGSIAGSISRKIAPWSNCIYRSDQFPFL